MLNGLSAWRATIHILRQPVDFPLGFFLDALGRPQWSQRRTGFNRFQVIKTSFEPGKIASGQLRALGKFDRHRIYCPATAIQLIVQVRSGR